MPGAFCHGPPTLCASRAAWQSHDWLLHLASTMQPCTCCTQPSHTAHAQSSRAGFCSGSPDWKTSDRCPSLPSCAQIGESGGATAVEEQLASAPDRCGIALRMPRVAMLFLTRGPMPHEALWTAWLAGARGHIQAECAAAAVCSAEDPGELRAPTALFSSRRLLCPHQCMHNMAMHCPFPRAPQGSCSCSTVSGLHEWCLCFLHRTQQDEWVVVVQRGLLHAGTA